MLHLASNITNKKIHFIGFSQGAQSALAALSEGNLLDIMHKLALLAPVAYVSHLPIVAVVALPTVAQLLEPWVHAVYRADKFQKYDYGAAENNQRYNSIYPPAYDLSRVPTQNLLLAYGDLDPLADPQDVERLESELRAGYKYVSKPKFAHLDFVSSINGKEELYDNVIAFFEN